MTKGLPRLEDIFRNPNQSDSPSTRQLTTPDNLVKVEILALDRVYNPQTTSVLLNPETISEQKSANWARQNIPGQSDPLLQWISGSERVVSFSLKLSLDTAHNPTVSGPDGANDLTIASVTVGDEVGGFEFAGTSIPVYEGAILASISNEPIFESALQQSKPFSWSLSIQNYLDYYRSLLVPRKSSRRNKLKAPPLVQLKMGTLLGNINTTESAKWFVAGYSFNISRYTPDLRPIEADVSLTFIEYKDRSQYINAEEATSRIFQGQVGAQVESYGNQIRGIDTSTIELGGTIGGIVS